MESGSNPILSRKDCEEAFVWRVRNLPYPKEVYSVTVDRESQEIVIRTSNRKCGSSLFFPSFSAPSLLCPDLHRRLLFLTACLLFFFPRRYFKRIKVPDMERMGLRLEEDSLTWTYSNGALVVSVRLSPCPLSVQSSAVVVDFFLFFLPSHSPKTKQVGCWGERSTKSLNRW